MRTSRLFRIVWRINGLMLLAAGLLLVGGAAVAGIAAMVASGRDPSVAVPVAVDPGRGESLFLGRVEEVEGTPYVVLPLRAGSGRHGSKGFSSGAYDGETRNLLFHDAGKGTSRWLLPEHGTVIREHHFLRDPAPDPGDGGAREAPVLAIRYELEPGEEPRGGAGRPGGALQVALSGPGGEGFAVVLEGVDDVLGYGPLQGTRQVVFFRRGTDYLAGALDLATRAPVQAAPLPRP